MFNNAKNAKLEIEDTYVDYISFGRGKKNLILIPGVGEGLKTLKGYAIPFSVMYRKYTKDYKVYSFSRRNKMPNGFTTEDMAKDIIKHMNDLGIKKADVVGVSQGGMIAQYLAIHAPDRINKLVLVVTVPKPNNVIEESVNTWLKMAKEKDFKGIIIDTAERSYVGKYLERNKKLYKLLNFYKNRATYDRFIIEAEACLSHNAYNKLDQIKNPTLIIGAQKDRVVGIEGSKELHDRITGSELYIYEDYSHGVYEQAKDFNSRILTYLEK